MLETTLLYQVSLSICLVVHTDVSCHRISWEVAGAYDSTRARLLLECAPATPTSKRVYQFTSLPVLLVGLYFIRPSLSNSTSYPFSC